MNDGLVIVLFGAAGLSFGGAYALVSQKKPWWAVGLTAVFGVLCLAAGWLYL